MHIGVVGDSNINPQDVTDFRSLFGLPANPPNIILNGPDPGLGLSEGEADLDLQISGMVAPKATIDFVVSEDTLTAAGVDLSAVYIVDNNSDDATSDVCARGAYGLGNGGGRQGSQASGSDPGVHEWLTPPRSSSASRRTS